MSLTGGQPLADQIRSQRICPSLAACLKLELFGVYDLRVVNTYCNNSSSRCAMGYSSATFCPYILQRRSVMIKDINVPYNNGAHQ
ncbi:hypothetical protein EXT57_07195 [Pectobacterium brasiliense]|nr:hypothetical protein [Pectobacterium carotovorum subsp. carotovorum]MCL6377150.1 hypothetical protein [Pectobacterium brasiliense]